MVNTHLSSEASLIIIVVVGLFFIGLGYLNTRKIYNNRNNSIFNSPVRKNLILLKGDSSFKSDAFLNLCFSFFNSLIIFKKLWLLA